MARGENRSPWGWSTVALAFVVTLTSGSVLLDRSVALTVAGLVTFAVAFAVHGRIAAGPGSARARPGPDRRRPSEWTGLRADTARGIVSGGE